MSNYLGVIALTAAAASVLTSAALLYQPDNAMPLAPRPEQQVPKYPTVSAGDLAKFDRYRALMADTLADDQTLLGADAMRVFGYQERVITDQRQLPERSAYRLAMVYRSGAHHYALIDDTLYKRGDRLPGGEVIRGINMAGVVIAKDGATNVLTVGDYVAKPIAEEDGGRVAPRRPRQQPGNSYEAAAATQRQLDIIRNAMQLLQHRGQRPPAP